MRILDVDTAGSALAADERLGFVVATREDMNTIGLFQSQEQGGPCLDAYRTVEPVHCDGLARNAGRWPSWRPVALELGFRSVTELPMRLADQTIGALNIYSK